MFKIVFTFVPFLFAALLYAVFVRKAARGARAKTAWCAVLAACASKFAAFRIFGGDAFAPELPEALIWFWGWAYSAMCILLALSLALFFIKPRIKAFLLPAAAAALSAWGMWNGIKPPAVREIEVVLDNLPAELDGYRILQISDLHASSASRRWRTAAVVEAANAAGADAIAVTGDIADGDPAVRAADVEPLKDLRAKDGVWLCTGNHEYYHGWREWEKAYGNLGLRFLCKKPLYINFMLRDHTGCAFPERFIRKVMRIIFGSADTYKNSPKRNFRPVIKTQRAYIRIVIRTIHPFHEPVIQTVKQFPKFHNFKSFLLKEFPFHAISYALT